MNCETEIIHILNQIYKVLLIISFFVCPYVVFRFLDLTFGSKK